MGAGDHQTRRCRRHARGAAAARVLRPGAREPDGPGGARHGLRRARPANPEAGLLRAGRAHSAPPGPARGRGSRRSQERRGFRAGGDFLGPRAAQRGESVAPAVRRRLGIGRALPQIFERAGQRPQHLDALRRAAAAARRDAGRHERAAQRALGAAAPPHRPARTARLDHRPGSLAPPHPGDAAAEDRGRARRGAPRNAGARLDAPRRPARGPQACPGNRRELLRALHPLHVGGAGVAVEPAVRRRGFRARRGLERNRRRRRDHLRSLPSQPYGLPAPLLCDLPQGIRGAARGRG